MLEQILFLIDQILRHPLFISFGSLFLGKLLLERWSYTNSRKDIKRDKSFEFIDEVASLLNKAISMSFGVIRRAANTNIDNTKFSQQSDSPDHLSELFNNRFSIRMKSKAYLESEQFCMDFEYLMIEIRTLNECILNAKSLNNIDQVVQVAKQRQSTLVHKYNLSDHEYTENLASPYDELAAWNSTIFRAANYFLTMALQELL